jgi:hypothetical protein
MGASLVLLGFGGRMFGPALRYRHSSAEGDVLKAEELVARVAWSRFCSSLGAAIAIGGMLLLAVTGVAMLLRLSDRAATVSVVLAVVAVIVLMALWSWAFVGRFGLYGIVAERQRPVARSTVSYPVEDQYIDHPVPAAANPVVETEDEANRSTGQRPAEQPSTAQQPSLGPQPATNGRQRPHVAPAAPAPDQAQDQRRSSRQRNPEPEAARKPGAALSVEDPAEATPEPVSRPDASRSEVINPSDAAALERILNAPEPETVTSGDTNATDSSMSETADVAGPVDPRERDSNT